MHALRRLSLALLLMSLISPTFAQEPACCDQLRKEVQILKEQQDKMLTIIKQGEMSEKKNFGVMESLLDILSNKFPDMKDTFKKFKDIYDQLGKMNRS